jgi:hypothetical protein
MNIRSTFQEINSIYKLTCYEVDIYNRIIEYFSQELFHNTKPKFTFHFLLIDECFYHFFFNIGGIDVKVSIKIENVVTFISKRSDGIKETYFYLSEQITYIKPSYDKCDFWDMVATIEFDKKQFVAEQKKLYGNIGYLYVKLRRLFMK